MFLGYFIKTKNENLNQKLLNHQDIGEVRWNIYQMTYKQTAMLAFVSEEIIHRVFHAFICKHLLNWFYCHENVGTLT